MGRLERKQQRILQDAADRKQAPLSAAEIFGPRATGVAQDTPTIEPVIVRLADVAPETIAWLWPGRLARGKLTLLVGDPGLGKSWVTCDVAARVSARRDWPDGAPGVGPADVLMLSAEDGLADTIRPRLDALGADVANVHHLAVLRYGEVERGVRLADAEVIEQAIRTTGALVVTIDPLSAYMGSVDTHRDAEVRGLLAPLAAVAERTGAALLGVMHLGKSAQRPAIYRAAGSIAFTAAARIVLAVAADPNQQDRRIVAPIKSNLSRPPAALAYTLDGGRLAWDSAPVDVDVETLLAGPPTGREADERSDAEQVIADLLDEISAWPIDAKVALAAGQAHGVHERTLRRAAIRCGIRIERVGFGRNGRWVWNRPAIADKQRTEPPSDEYVSSMSSMSNQAHIGDNTHIEDTKTTIARARGSVHRV